MNGEERFSREIVKQKVELISSMLVDLSKKFDFHFSFNYSLNDSKKTPFLSDILLNRGITISTIDAYIRQLSLVRFEQQAIMSMIADGALVYQCINDEDQPDGIKDPLELGKIYIVDHVYPVKNSEYCVFHLRDMDATPAIGYKSERFRMLFNKHSFN